MSFDLTLVPWQPEFLARYFTPVCLSLLRVPEWGGND